MIAALVLAAGRGSRFGGGKLGAEIGGRALIEYPIAAALASERLDRILVAVPARAGGLRERVLMLGAEPLEVEDPGGGLSVSLRAGVGELLDADAILVLLGDQPLIGRGAIEAVLGASVGAPLAVRATYGGAPGHPVLIKPPLYPKIAELSGDRGAAALLRGPGILTAECGAAERALDVDTPADLARARELLDG